MIETKKLKELIKLMVENDLTELDLQAAEERVSLKRSGPGAPVVYAPAAAPTPASPPQAPPAAAPAEPEHGSGHVTIDSPMVGTFFAASSPDAKPFVSAGDTVSPDTVVCILEAMKVFNEIKAETSGTVRRVLVENGQSVEFGQPLFEVQPA